MRLRFQANNTIFTHQQILNCILNLTMTMRSCTNDVPTELQLGSSSYSSCSGSAFKYMRGFVALTCMIAAYLGQQQQKKEEGDAPSLHRPHLTTIFGDDGLYGRSLSVLHGTWVVVYVLLVRFLLTHQISIVFDWVKDLIDSTNSAMKRVSSCEAAARIRSTVSLSSARILSLANCPALGESGKDLLSSKEPFLPIDEIKQLSLTDISDIFRYASEVCHPSLDRQAYCSCLREPVRNSLRAIENVARRFGKRETDVILHPYRSEKDDEIDAIRFVAATRIFAEWRKESLVPEKARKGYSMSMIIVRRDLFRTLGNSKQQSTLGSLGTL